MLSELTAASDMLLVALERYSAVCLAIQSSYAHGYKPHKVDPQLLPRLDAEIDLATSLQSKLSCAKAAISWSRNCSHSHVTVDDMPPEVLASIFHLVLSSHPCAKRDYRILDKKTDLMYPAVLSRVCSRWRSIAFSTPTLWTHIDLSTSTLLNKQHIDCLTKLHLSHVGQLSLNVHIFDARGYEVSRSPHRSGIDSIIVGSITRLASRTSSLNMNELGLINPNSYRKLLSALLHDSTPGTLTKLTISWYSNRIYGGHSFLNPNDGPVNHGSTVGLPREQLENILSHITILRLAGPYPQWTSRAYHGLVELRLVGRETIDEPDLVGILRASPGLRILQFGLPISNSLPANAQAVPIVLSDLEALIVWQTSCTLLPSLLRWLAPGPKPLQFGFRVQEETDALTSEVLQLKEDSLPSFFLRSRLNRVYAKYMGALSAIELLELSPGIQELAISCASFDTFPLMEDTTVGSTSECHLRYFQLSHSSVYVEAVLGFISHPTFTIGVIVFHDCRLFRHGVQIPDEQVAIQVEELKASNPEVKFIVRSREESYLVQVGSWGPGASL
ncbi:putative F-box-like domain protein [Rhizoctonia solani 123E]|uniref:Putative F-box-like domain protein n=1 Tax=Rhizoctonia solani 123E TaxID=1423351 RepID=A0A074RS64_9AGAM|nr:putative F-box-like domain protein [Rhizoctonia solani 123E]